MAARKKLRRKTGTTVTSTSGSVQTPVNVEDLLAAILQLQETVNEIIVRHNALCTDTAHAGDAVTGTAQADAALFTAPSFTP